MTDAVVKRVNTILDKHAPPVLVSALEAFVAVLRNKNSSAPVDVQLFFSDPKKLRTKLGRMDTTEVDYQIMLNKAEQLTKIKAQMSGSVTLDGKQVNLGDFAFMVDWALNFCEAAKIDLAKKGKEALIEQKQQEIDRAQLKLQRFERMFADENEHGFRDFYGKVIQQLELRKATFDAVQDLD